MPLMFYPHEDDLESSGISEKLEVLLEAAGRYKAAVLDAAAAAKPVEENGNGKKRSMPRDLAVAFNWEEIAKLLREIRDMPEATPANKKGKAQNLTKLAEVYEVLRGAKMAKLEAVRLALINEANQLQAGSQVA